MDRYISRLGFWAIKIENYVALFYMFIHYQYWEVIIHTQGRKESITRKFTYFKWWYNR